MTFDNMAMWPEHWLRPPADVEGLRDLNTQVWADSVVLGRWPEEAARLMAACQTAPDYHELLGRLVRTEELLLGEAARRRFQTEFARQVAIRGR